MKRLKKNNKGFTLVEIIVVLVILAVLAAALIPAMTGFVEDARGKAYITEARTAYVAAQAYSTETFTTYKPAAGTVQDYISGQLTASTLDTTTNVIYKRMLGSCTAGAQITGVTVDGNGKITQLIYKVDKYTVTINPGGTTDITE